MKNSRDPKKAQPATVPLPIQAAAHVAQAVAILKAMDTRPSKAIIPDLSPYVDEIRQLKYEPIGIVEAA